MKVWIVLDGDYDSSHVVAVYPTEAMANAHEAEMGGWIEEQEIRSDLHPDVTSEEKKAERAAEAAERKRKYEERVRQDKRSAEMRANTKPRPPHMGLCHCPTFSSSSRWLNEHGYCAYCGGFTHTVYRQHMGEDALRNAIGDLAKHQRDKMLEIAGLSTTKRA